MCNIQIFRGFLIRKKIPIIVAFSFITFISIYLALNVVRTHEATKDHSKLMPSIVNPWQYFKKMYRKYWSDNITDCSARIEIDAVKFYERYNCTGHKLCALNRKTELIYQPQRYACTDMQKCVTALVKLSGEREEKLVDQIASLRKYYPEMAMVIIADDYVRDISFKLQTLLDNNSKIYFKRLPETVGLSNGRMIGLSHVKTPLFLLLDDDFVFTERTDIKNLFELLINTNLGLVAGNTDNCDWFGVLRFENNGKERYVENHQRAVYFELQNYPGCYQVDITKNFFIGKKDVVLGVGGWTKWLMIAEHEDFFFNLKVNDVPVAVCPYVYIDHRQVMDRIRRQRKYSFSYFYNLFLDKWNITKVKQLKNAE